MSSVSPLSPSGGPTAPAGNPNGAGNPVNFGNQQPAGQVLNDQQIAQQMPDPNQIGEALAAGLSQQLAASNQTQQQFMESQSAATQAQNAAMQELTNTLQGMQQASQAQLNQQNAPDYNAQFALSDQERTELGDVGMTAVQKLVDRTLAQSTDEIVSRASQSSLTEINALKQQLAEAKQQIQSQQVDHGAQFRQQANTVLAARQLDVQRMQTDPNWNEFGSQVANTITGETYAQAMESAINGQNLQSFTRVLDQYQQTVQAKQQQALPPSNQSGFGGDSRQGFVPQQGNPQIDAELQQLGEQAHALRDRRMKTQISAEEFGAGIREITAKVDALKAQQPASDPQQQPQIF